MHNADFRGPAWGRDGRNLNSNLPMGYREPTDAEVEAVLSSVSFDCPECGNSTAGSEVQHPDGRVYCSEGCLDAAMWREAIERKAAVQCEVWRAFAADADRRLYRTVGRFRVALLLAIGSWILVGIVLWMAWGRLWR